MNRPRRAALRMALGLGALLGATGAGAATAAAPVRRPPPLVWDQRLLLAFGTTVRLQAGHADGATLGRALAAAVAAVQAVDQRMSLFRPDSDLVRLNHNGVLHQPDPGFLRLLRAALQVARRSGGRFDPTVQPLWALWQQAAAEHRRPGPRELQGALNRCGWWRVHVDDRRVAFTQPGMALTLNGIAQGHAADLAREALQAHGVRHALLDTGEWWPIGAPENGGPWRLGIADPHATQRLLGRLQADGRAVACSSDDKLAFSADRRDHHILDPRSGFSPPRLATVVVAAPSATLADALTKVMFMGGIADALALARQWRVDVLACDKQGRWAASAGLPLRLG